jgi:uncharacterized membrane protein YbhN (UPF0104 family)/O-antigen ligase
MGRNGMQKKWKLLGTSAFFLAIGLWISGTDNLFQELRRFPIWAIVGVMVAFFLNIVVVSFRLWRLLAHFGVRIPFLAANSANLQGQFASLFMNSFIGQIAGRYVVLRQYDMSLMVSTILTLIERFIILIVFGGLCLVGVIWLFGSDIIWNFLDEALLPLICVTILLSLISSLWFGSSTLEKEILARLFSSTGLRKFLEMAGLTLLAQAFVLVAFVLGAMALAPDTKFASLFAAATITSFAATMRTSVGGWGIRELAAIFAFGQIGIPAPSAMAVSVLVGLGSTAITLLVYPLAFNAPSRKNLNGEAPVPVSSRFSLEKVGVCALSIAVSTLIFFHFHIPLFGGAINFNLADPFALIALAAVLVHCIAMRKLPVWRIPGFNKFLLILSAMILFSFLWGVRTIGVTSWVLSGKLLGWLVILGYLCVGSLTVSWLGWRGIRRVRETIIVTASVIVLAWIFIKSFPSIFSDMPLPLNFEGFSDNRNVFAFQMLACSVLFLAYSVSQEKQKNRIIHYSGGAHFIKKTTLYTVFHGLIIVGIAFSGSRSGIITGIALLVFAYVFRFASRRMLMYSLCGAIFLFMSINSISDGSGTGGVASSISDESSNIERLGTIKHSLELWKDNPFFGTGLGVFYEKSPAWLSRNIVIHSTPVWVLVEFGLFGMAIFLFIFARMVVSIWRQGLSASRNRAALMLLGVFAIFGLPHEIFYQQIFWLVLGICLALPSGTDRLPRNVEKVAA